MQNKYVTFINMTLKNKPENFETLSMEEKYNFVRTGFCKIISRIGKLKKSTILKIAGKYSAVAVKATYAFHDKSQRGGFLGEEVIVDERL